MSIGLDTFCDRKLHDWWNIGRYGGGGSGHLQSTMMILTDHQVNVTKCICVHDRTIRINWSKSKQRIENFYFPPFTIHCRTIKLHVVRSLAINKIETFYSLQHTRDTCCLIFGVLLVFAFNTSENNTKASKNK